ncbi:MAG: peptidylprolyl isomerase [Anaerolineales bacterium]|nr:peptidylprolyl isomerase [Anaerolineales bacterium]
MARRPRGAVVNRRHLARLERENIQNNYITIAAIVIVSLVVLLVIGGLVYDRVIVAGQPVATVNGVEITTREFRSRVIYERYNLVIQYVNTANTAQQFGTDAQFIGFFQNSLNQIELQLDVELLGRDVINNLIEEEIIRQKAEEMGITVTEEEIQKTLDEFFGYYGGEQPPTPTEVPTTRPTSTLSAFQLTVTAPTATPTLTATVSTDAPVEGTPATEGTPAAEEPTVTPDTPTEEPTATAVADGPTPTATLIPPTATPYTLEAYETDLKNFFSERRGIDENDLRYWIESDLLREKVLEAVTADLSPDQDQVWARHILVEDEATAQAVLARLEAGEDFAALAAELSTDSANASQGGDLGWFGLGEMDPEFEKVAFNTEIGEISAPVQTTFGWHLIQVIGHELRPLSASELVELRQTEFEEWLTQQRQLMDAQIVLFDYWADRIPDEPSITPIDLQSVLAPILSTPTPAGPATTPEP